MNKIFHDIEQHRLVEFHQHTIDCYSNYNLPTEPQCGFNVVWYTKE